MNEIADEPELLKAREMGFDLGSSPTMTPQQVDLATYGVLNRDRLAQDRRNKKPAVPFIKTGTSRSCQVFYLRRDIARWLLANYTGGDIR